MSLERQYRQQCRDIRAGRYGDWHEKMKELSADEDVPRTDFPVVDEELQQTCNAIADLMEQQRRRSVGDGRIEHTDWCE